MRQGALANCEGAVQFACTHKMDEQIGRDPSQPVLIAQGFSKGSDVL